MSEQYIHLGKISGVFGVKGWVKVYSYTDPREGIVAYSYWFLQQGSAFKRYEVIEGKRQGKLVIASLQGIDSREQAELLAGQDIYIEREQLPETEENEYYWSDLVGLKVETTQGVELGRVDHLLRTGANDVLVVVGERERLLPFVQGHTVMTVDLEQGMMIVDWDPDF